MESLIFSLNYDVIRVIVSFLNDKDLCNFLTTNTHWFSSLDELFWQLRFKETYGSIKLASKSSEILYKEIRNAENTCSVLAWSISRLPDPGYSILYNLYLWSFTNQLESPRDPSPAYHDPNCIYFPYQIFHVFKQYIPERDLFGRHSTCWRILQTVLRTDPPNINIKQIKYATEIIQAFMVVATLKDKDTFLHLYKVYNFAHSKFFGWDSYLYNIAADYLIKRGSLDESLYLMQILEI